MTDELWVVRAGRKAKWADEFVAGSYIAVWFREFDADDLSELDENSLRARTSSPRDRSRVNQLIAFAHRMQPGDLVIVPRLTSKHRDYLFAEITGHYRHEATAPASGTHRRVVGWLGRFERDARSQAALNTMGAMATVIRPSTVEPELRQLLTALEPL
jgi:predicted Mrr-cat superfamily restriction endonuclease